jgi:hypothetical protein
VQSLHLVAGVCEDIRDVGNPHPIHFSFEPPLACKALPQKFNSYAVLLLLYYKADGDVSVPLLSVTFIDVFCEVRIKYLKLAIKHLRAIPVTEVEDCTTDRQPQRGLSS